MPFLDLLLDVGVLEIVLLEGPLLLLLATTP